MKTQTNEQLYQNVIINNMADNMSQSLMPHLENMNNKDELIFNMNEALINKAQANNDMTAYNFHKKLRHDNQRSMINNLQNSNSVAGLFLRENIKENFAEFWEQVKPMAPAQQFMRLDGLKTDALIINKKQIQRNGRFQISQIGAGVDEVSNLSMQNFEYRVFEMKTMATVNRDSELFTQKVYGISLSQEYLHSFLEAQTLSINDFLLLGNKSFKVEGICGLKEVEKTMVTAGKTASAYIAAGESSKLFDLFKDACEKISMRGMGANGYNADTLLVPSNVYSTLQSAIWYPSEAGGTGVSLVGNAMTMKQALEQRLGLTIYAWHGLNDFNNSGKSRTVLCNARNSNLSYAIAKDIRFTTQNDFLDIKTMADFRLSEAMYDDIGIFEYIVGL